MIRAMGELNSFLGQHGIKYFSAHEVVQLGRTRHGETITVPPRDMWWRIVPTLCILDRVREAVGTIRVLSGYRPDGYNRAVGGARKSLHVEFNAIDWRPYDFDAWTIDDLEEVFWEVVGGGEQFVGLGVYQDPNPNDDVRAGFIHTDTRGLVLGKPGARWTG